VVDVSVLIGEVARRNRIRLAEDDPIFAEATVFEAIIAEAAARFDGVMLRAADTVSFRLEAEFRKARDFAIAEVDAAEKVAVSLLQGAGAWSAAELQRRTAVTCDAVDASVGAMLASVVATFEAKVAVVDEARRVTIIAAAVAVGCR
jgi:hypothetical protein